MQWILRYCFFAVGLLAGQSEATAQESTGASSTGKRVALVIGNSDYKNTPKLENPKNDAADMAAALRQLGFHVIEGRDLDKASMDRTVRDFSEALSSAKVGLLFYAGHGLQVGGENYLVPVDAKLTTAAALDFEMVRLDLVQRTMERESATNIIILDACRDNPLARNLARALGTRSTRIGRGLAPVESGEGTLISFSTQPGNVALDGEGRNSPFASALVKHIGTVGEDLPSILISVRNDVMNATNRRQVPWEHSALTAKFYFSPPKMTVEQQLEATYWDAIKNSTTPGPIAGYLERYPNGAFAALARALIEDLEKNEAAERLAREAEQRRLEAELKRLEEERKTAEAQRLETQRRADEMRKSAEVQVPAGNAEADRVASSKSEQEGAERDRQLKLIMEELLRARDSARTAEEQRLAAQKDAIEAIKSADAAKAAAVAEAKRVGESKIALLPTPDARPTGPFDGHWIVKQVSNGNCARATGAWRLQIQGSVAIAQLDGVTRRGTVKSNGALRVESRDATGTRPVIYSGILKGAGGSGSYHAEGTTCAGTFTVSRNQ